MATGFHVDGTVLKRARVDLGLTQAELSERAGVGQAAISLWENGGRSGLAAHLMSVCNALGLQVEDVMVPAEELEERIRAIVDDAPPLTAAQRAKLAAILAPGRKRAPRRPTKAQT